MRATTNYFQWNVSALLHKFSRITCAQLHLLVWFKSGSLSPPWLDNTIPISRGNRSNSQRNQSFCSNGLLDTTHLLMRYLCYVTARLFLFHVHSPSSHKSFGSGYHHGPSSRKSSAGASSLASTGSVQSSPGKSFS